MKAWQDQHDQIVFTIGILLVLLWILEARTVKPSAFRVMEFLGHTCPSKYKVQVGVVKTSCKKRHNLMVSHAYKLVPMEKNQFIFVQETG